MNLSMTFNDKPSIDMEDDSIDIEDDNIDMG
jgi:hypothetical protein